MRFQKKVPDPVPNGVRIILLDNDRLVRTDATLAVDQKGYRITVDGQQYEHCSTTPDGTWEYAPMK